jgi:hypothetical protein
VHGADCGYKLQQIVTAFHGETYEEDGIIEGVKAVLTPAFE